MLATTRFLPNTNVEVVDIDAFLRARGDHPDDQCTVVYCNATGAELGPLSDTDTHWETGEEIVEVDIGARFWYARSHVDLMLPSERAVHLYPTRSQNETARPLGR